MRSNKKTKEHFQTLQELSREIHTYNSILGLLHWDQETYMPAGAIEPRSNQIALLSELVHHKKISRSFKETLGKLVNLSSGKVKVQGLSKEEKVCLVHWHREYLRNTKLPARFVKEFSKLTSEATQVWAIAKKNNDFKLFAPFLTKIIEMKREQAKILGFEKHPYDALLESYEPCMTTRKVEHIFQDLRKQLQALLGKIRKKKPIDTRFLERTVDRKKQMQIAAQIVKALPMEEEYTRLDLSAHPFSLALHPHDSRITTRILPNTFMSNVFSVLHEAGHSMYEMGLKTNTWGTPLSEPVSLSIHESQSRFWETLIGRSSAFWQGQYQSLQQILPALKKVPLEKFYKAINHVSPAFLRVESDEVCYGLHVIVRFEIEKELISGQLQVADLPKAWNAKMKELLGVDVPSDTLGCLQDVHWSLGDFGYFPTYALGNLFAAQFFNAFAKAHPDYEKRIASGDLHFIRDWLKENIHRYGKTYDAEQLVKKVTGKPLSADSYCKYLKEKYHPLYTI